MMELAEILQKYQYIAGVDEVGRGPLVGAVVTAAVILDPNNPIEGLNDSKKLSEKKRLLLAEEIKAKALAWSLGRAERHEIDEINILKATMLAMQRAVNALAIHPEYVLIDGNKCPILTYPCLAIVKGDGLVPAISAASILAKVARDAYMQQIALKYQGYGFEAHVGYGTRQHVKALQRYGVLPIHRVHYKPIRALLAT